MKQTSWTLCAAQKRKNKVTWFNVTWILFVNLLEINGIIITVNDFPADAYSMWKQLQKPSCAYLDLTLFSLSSSFVQCDDQQAKTLQLPIWVAEITSNMLTSSWNSSPNHIKYPWVSRCRHINSGFIVEQHLTLACCLLDTCTPIRPHTRLFTSLSFSFEHLLWTLIDLFGPVYITTVNSKRSCDAIGWTDITIQLAERGPETLLTWHILNPTHHGK